MWLSWLEHCPLDPKVTGSVPSQGTCPSCRVSRGQDVLEKASNVSLSHGSLCLSLSLFLSAMTICPQVRIKIKEEEERTVKEDIG